MNTSDKNLNNSSSNSLVSNKNMDYNQYITMMKREHLDKVHQCSKCQTNYIKSLYKEKYEDYEDKEIEEYIYLMQNKYNSDLCSMCLTEQYCMGLKCPGCSMETGDGSTCMMCFQWEDDNGSYSE